MEYEKKYVKRFNSFKVRKLLSQKVFKCLKNKDFKSKKFLKKSKFNNYCLVHKEIIYSVASC